MYQLRRGGKHHACFHFCAREKHSINDDGDLCVILSIYVHDHGGGDHHYYDYVSGSSLCDAYDDHDYCSYYVLHVYGVSILPQKILHYVKYLLKYNLISLLQFLSISQCVLAFSQ